MNREIQLLTRTAGLENMTAEPEILHGGHLHRMFAVTTERGRFAVKCLNPEVMARPEAWDNFIRSEEIARMAADVIPACPAVLINGCPVVRLEHCWMIFPHLDGRCVPNEEITSVMAYKIGEILAKIHGMTELSAVTADPAPVRVWGNGDAAHPEHADLLNRWEQHRVRETYGKTVLSHRDLEPKNVLWHNGNPTLIDWEAAGEINGAEDLFTTALCFAKSADGISKERFTAFFAGYFTHADPADFDGCDWRQVSGCFYDLTDWLAYNLTRDEREIGEEQAEWAMAELIRYDGMRDEILGWIRDFFDHIEFVTHST